MNLQFCDHAIQRMFERRIHVADVRSVVENGEVIENYPEDGPFSSRLMMGRPRRKPLHVVEADTLPEEFAIVITAYEPEPRRWLPPDYRERNP